MIDICLINPPQQALREPTAYIPLGLAYLATCLESGGIEVKVINLAEGYRPLPEAKYYGITCQVATLRSTAEVARRIRHNYPKAVIIIGGAQASTDPQQVLNYTQADLVIMGEAEEFLPKLVKGEIQAGKIADAGIISDLDSLPIPRREYFNFNHVVNVTGVHGSKLPSTTVIDTRGCPYNCKFCCRGHPMLTHFRTRAPELIRQELEYVKRNYGVKHVRFVDDCFTANKKYTLSLCHAIEDLGMTFIIITRTDRVDKEILEALREAGCVQVDFGIESGSQRLLDVMNKRLTVEQNARAIELAHEVGIHIKAFLMMNYPGETEDDRKQTLEFIKRTQVDDFTLSVYQPLSGGYFYPDSNIEFQSFKAKVSESINESRNLCLGGCTQKLKEGTYENSCDFDECV